MPQLAARLRLQRVAALAATTVLAACSSPMPVPPAPAPAPRPSTAQQPAPAPMPAPAPAPAPAPMPAPAAAPVPAEPPGVAARFPEPAVDFRTPAFAPGRTTFTSAAEAQDVLLGLARDHGAAVQRVKLGEGLDGTVIEALLFSSLGQPSPEAVRTSGRATVVLHGPQRPDAPAATEALLAVAQELAAGRLRGVLERLNVIVWTQVPGGGPGTERDHLLLNTPQAQAFARLVREYQPVVVAEAAEYLPSAEFAQRYGAVERHDAMLQVATTGNMAPFVSKAAQEWFHEPVAAALRQQGLAADWHYAVAPERRLAMGSPRPDLSRNAQGLKQIVSLAIESRGEPAGGRLHLKRRVHTLVTGLAQVLHSADERGADLLKLRQYVEAEVSAQACKGMLTVEAELTPGEYTLRMLDPASGAEKSTLVAWDSALALRELRSRPRPCGYWLDASQTAAVSRLRLLGVRVEQVASKGVVQGDTYAEAAPGSREVKMVSALLDLAPGAYYVPLSQPLAHVAAAALEPDTPYSYWAGGLVTGLNKAARVTAWPGVKVTALP